MHKNIILTTFFLLIKTLCLQAQNDSSKAVKDIHLLAKFTNADFNLGNIPVGKNTSFNVYIKNISKVDTLWVIDVKVGCGCTTPRYRAHEPILPGETSYITLGFNGSARGEFIKTADIIFKGGQIKQIKFQGNAIIDTLSSSPEIKQIAK